jgi:hypothetical protein
LVDCVLYYYAGGVVYIAQQAMQTSLYFTK